MPVFGAYEWNMTEHNLAVGYVQLSRLDLMFIDGFVIGVSVMLVSEELFWMRDWAGVRAKWEERMEQQMQRWKCSPRCWRWTRQWEVPAWMGLACKVQVAALGDLYKASCCHHSCGPSLGARCSHDEKWTLWWRLCPLVSLVLHVRISLRHKHIIQHHNWKV